MATMLLSTFSLTTMAHRAPRPLDHPTMNLLYFFVDDLRPELGAYGAPRAATAGSPNIDALAADALVFDRAYSQQAVCGPSRNSFLSGRRPDTTKTYTFKNSFRDVGPEWTSMLGLFKSNGYAVAGQGKVYHPSSPPLDDGNKSWSEAFLPYPEWSQAGDPCPGTPDDVVYDPISETSSSSSSSSAAGAPAYPANALNGPACPLNNAQASNLTDQRIADLAVHNLGVLAAAKEPWVLAVGFHKPHLPWAVPSEFYDLAPAATAITLPLHQTPPTGMPEAAWWSCSESELAGYSNVNISDANPPLDAALVREWRRGYYASVAYTDYLVGSVLTALAATGEAENTVVVLHGDHGWQLGEHGEWCKQSNFELATRVPLIIRVPGTAGAASRGKRTRAFVELVDMYRSLADVFNLSPVEEGVEGSSFAPLLLADPTGKNHSAHAFSQYPRCAGGADCMMFARADIAVMGYSIRSELSRYTEWRTWDGKALKADWTRAGRVGVEFYPHAASDPTGSSISDFDNSENVNEANDPSKKDEVAKCAALLAAQFNK